MNLNPPVRGAPYIFYWCLNSQANALLFQVNPTLAAGDVQVAKDDGAPVNITTLPVVDADFTKRIKVALSASEMDADNVSILFSDAAGAEWCDSFYNLQPSGLGVPGTVNADGTETTTSFKTSLTQASNFFNNAFILFTDGTLQGQSRKISSYAQTNGVITVGTAFTAAPGNDPFIIIGRSE